LRSARDRLANQSILGANLRQRYVIVVGVQREDRRMEFNPEPDTSIRSGDSSSCSAGLTAPAPRSGSRRGG
jgi:Trk K+ transport system NAD-binding subunit